MLAKLYRFLLSFLILFLLGAGAPPVLAQGLAQVYASGPELVILADPATSSLRIPAPAAALAPRRNAIGNIAVTFLDPAHPDIDGSPCLAFPPEAQVAYNFAANVWAAYLNTPVTIRISACWRDLGNPYALGSAGPRLVANVQSLPQTNNRWYPLALADSLAKSDLSPGNYAITSRFNSNIVPDFSWNFSTTTNPTINQYDFASVVLHEIGHGLGFSGTMRVSGGLGTYNLCTSPPSPFCAPMIYDTFTQAGDGTPLLNEPNTSSQLASVLTSAVYFSGPKANAANNGQRVRLYAPSPWLQGSSYSHLDSVFDNTPNALMTYSLNNSESVHDPGPVALGILGDIGWTISTGTVPPVAPSGLSANPVSASQIDLGWTDNSGNETGFQIERGWDGMVFTPLFTTTANTSSYSDSSLLGGTKYFYRVRAVSGTLVSAYSNTIQAVTQGPPPPPGALTAFASGDTQINLSWTDNSNIETGYLIERYDDLSAAWTPLFTTLPNVTFYLDTGLGVGKTYQYRVSTVSPLPNGNSAPAGPVTATTWAVVLRIYLGLIFR